MYRFTDDLALKKFFFFFLRNVLTVMATAEQHRHTAIVVKSATTFRLFVLLDIDITCGPFKSEKAAGSHRK